MEGALSSQFQVPTMMSACHLPTIRSIWRGLTSTNLSLPPRKHVADLRRLNPLSRACPCLVLTATMMFVRFAWKDFIITSLPRGTDDSPAATCTTALHYDLALPIHLLSLLPL
ncbi:hypothetical protein L6164_007913 [Bauhinia variegata]|uniref:Uncharacterized protein n=1 Tax=Bauhinia variegata TaxID=167791 RepID=A0ACB9PGH1_BAUVA|nr:hypothetical protein L6164_007913 [Bauhinia variegata]